jgi:hypothetical protein
VLVVPLSADSTTIFFPGVSNNRFAIFFIRSGLPTDVPPNFNTTISIFLRAAKIEADLGFEIHAFKIL